MDKPYGLTPKRDFADAYAWTLHNHQALHPEAILANQIIERWALVAAIPDGEDSAGRQKVRLPSAGELAVRACDLAAAATAEYARRGWVQEIPSPDDAEKAWDEKYGDKKKNHR